MSSTLSHNWILVCDAARARLFESTNRTGAWVEVACYANPELRGPLRASAEGRTVPRTQESMGGARHVIEPHEPKKDRSARLFAHRIAEELRAAHERRRYARLFVVAPPRFLGVICAEIGDMDAAGVAGTLGKDVVGLPAEVAERHIRAAFPRDFAAEARAGHAPADNEEAQRDIS